MDKLATIQKELLDGLDILASLESNWDGYNASKFNKKTIDNGKYLLDLIFQKYPSFAQKIKDIFIEPATNGVIYFKIDYDSTVLQNQQCVFHSTVWFSMHMENNSPKI